MSRLDELIREFCPNGVEYKKVGEICDILRGKRLTVKELSDDFQYPVIHGGTAPMGYYHSTNRKAGTTIVINTGNAGCVFYIDEEFWSSDACFSLYPCDDVLDRYLYFFVSSKEAVLKSRIRSGAMPTIDSNAVSSLEIPVPPLPVQSEIVRILDNFTELTAELTARKKQYEYYRDELLHLDGEKVAIQDLFDTRNGFTPSKDNPLFWEDGTLPWFKLDDINNKGRVLSESYLHITPAALKKSGLFPKNSIIISTSATIGEYALITVPFLCNQRFTCLTVKKSYTDMVNIRYLMHYCPMLSKFCKEHLNQGNFASVDMKQFAQFEFVIPSMDDQQRIVSILDRFDALCNDITAGLPAEIDARQKQYEYYRDKLLSFKEKVS